MAGSAKEPVCDYRMNDSVDDAMVVLQEATAAIARVSHQLSGYEGSQKEVASALKEISDRVTRLESAVDSGTQPAQQKVKPPLFIKVKNSSGASSFFFFFFFFFS